MNRPQIRYQYITMFVFSSVLLCLNSNSNLRDIISKCILRYNINNINNKRKYYYLAVVGLALILVASLPDSSLLARVTLFPNKQYLGIVIPTTPASTLPV